MAYITYYSRSIQTSTICTWVHLDCVARHHSKQPLAKLAKVGIIVCGSKSPPNQSSNPAKIWTKPGVLQNTNFYHLKGVWKICGVSKAHEEISQPHGSSHGQWFISAPNRTGSEILKTAEMRFRGTEAYRTLWWWWSKNQFWGWIESFD